MKYTNITVPFSILVIATISVWSDTYKDARKQLENNVLPRFVEEQIKNQYNTVPADLPKAVTFPEIETLLSKYQEQNESSLESVIQIVEPILLSQEGIHVQRQSRDESVNTILSKQVNLDLLINIAYSRNPSIKAASQAWQASLQRYPQAAYLEGILRQYNSFTKRLNLVLGGMQPQKQMIDTEWPFPGITSLRGNIVQTDIEIAKQGFAIALRNVLSDVKKTFHDFVYIHQAIDITQENTKLLEQMLDVASQKFEAGETSYSDVIKARVALSKLTDNLITLEDQRETINAKLNTLLDRSPQESFGNHISVQISNIPLKLQRLYEVANVERQEILQMQSRVERTRLMIELAQEMNRPDPTLGVSYFQERSGLLVGSDPDRGTFQSSPRMNIRPWFGQRESFIAEMQQRRQELANKLENTINQTLFEVKRAHFSLDAAYREFELFRTTLIPEARQALEVADTDYLGARIDFLDYLDAQRTWLDFNLSHYKAQSEFGKTLAELERVTGTSLINVQ